MGNLKLVFFLAYKTMLKGSRWALALIIMVTSLSFVNLIFISSILSGVTNTLDTQLVSNILANVVIDPPEDKYYIEDAAVTRDRILQTPGVTGVGLHLTSHALIEYEWREKRLPGDKGKSGTWSVIGVDPENEINVTEIHERIIQGSYLSPGDRDEIVLGIEITGGEGSQRASHLNLGGAVVGDKVRLTYPNGIRREYRIKGIFQAKEMMNADHLSFITRKEMISVMGDQVFSDRASQILVSIEKTGDEKRFIEEFRTLGIAGEIRGWSEYGGAMRGMVSSFSVIASLIGGIGLTVAAIVMFIVIYIGVVNKKRQIGILRAIGIKDRLIVYSYLLQALFYAVSGMIIGGMIVSFLLEPYFFHHPLDLPIGPVSLFIDPGTIRNAVLGLTSAAFLAGVVPVISITRQSIIRAIWGA
ncbi:MAG: FtsX-like permease family protein [Chloroflexota bacterium]